MLAHENLVFYTPNFPPVEARNIRPFWWANAKGERTELLVALTEQGATREE